MPEELPTTRTSIEGRIGTGAILLRAVSVLVAAAGVAAGLAALKGRGLDATYVLGNSSVAYLLLPFLAGWAMPRRLHAIILGLAATATALVMFYFTASTLYLGSLSLDFSLGRWFLAGAISGTLLSLLGHAAHQQRRLLYLAPVLLVLEPFATAAAAGIGLGSGAPPAAHLLAGSLEAGLGVALLLLLRRIHWRNRQVAAR